MPGEEWCMAGTRKQANHVPKKRGVGAACEIPLHKTHIYSKYKCFMKQSVGINGISELGRKKRFRCC